MTADSPIHGSAMLQMNSGKILSRQPVPRLVGQLRPGQREREPARLRRHARPDRRADQRRQELVERLHARRVPGRRILRSSGDADPRPATGPTGMTDADAARSCSTRCSEYNHEHLAAARRQQRTWPPASPATSWPSRCSSTPPRRSICAKETEETQELYGIDEPQTAGLRPQVPARPAAGRARRAVHPDLLRRRPQRRQLGRPRRPGEEPQLARRRHRQADRRAAQGPEAARPARRDAGRLGRRVRPPADRRVRQGHRPRPQRLRLHDVDGRRRHQGRRQRRRDRRARQRRRRATASTSSTCTPPSCTRWASTRTG